MKKLTGIASTCLCLIAGAVGAQTPEPGVSQEQSLAEARQQSSTASVSALNAELFYQLLIGEMTAQEGEAGTGYALILDAARKTGNVELYQRATDIALKSRSGEAALQAAQAWTQAAPDSREANRYLLQILIVLGRISDTLDPLKAEFRLTPQIEHPALFATVPRAYARASDKKLASAVVEEALAPYLANPATAGAAWSCVARMRLAASNAPGAIEATERAQAADPRAELPALIALELMDAAPAQAEPLVRRYLDGNPQVVSEVRMGYARALLDAQRYSEAAAQAQIVTGSNPEFAEAWLVLGTLQLQDNHLAPAQASLERYVDLVLKQPPPAEGERSRGLSQAYLALSQISEKRKDFAAAESWLGKIENSSELVQAQARRASILASQGKLDQGLQLIRQLPGKTPAEARLRLNAEIGLLRDAKQYRMAYNALGEALKTSPEDAELIYDQAMMAEKMDSLSEMERLLRQVMKLKPDYHHAYNALGYSLAERNLRLPEAKELIQKALTYAPADPFIKDSLGWVEFRLGNKAEAARIFETAYRARPDAEIAAHYGEVLWSMGNRERAMSIWREGKLLNPDNETLLETLKRLRVRL